MPSTLLRKTSHSSVTITYDMEGVSLINARRLSHVDMTFTHSGGNANTYINKTASWPYNTTSSVERRYDYCYCILKRTAEGQSVQ